MILKKTFAMAMLVLVTLVACKDQKKQEQEAIDEAKPEIEQEMAAETAKKKADSLLQVKKDSITKDSLRQVKEHGHAH